MIFFYCDNGAYFYNVNLYDIYFLLYSILLSAIPVEGDPVSIISKIILIKLNIISILFNTIKRQFLFYLIMSNANW